MRSAKLNTQVPFCNSFVAYWQLTQPESSLRDDQSDNSPTANDLLSVAPTMAHLEWMMGSRDPTTNQPPCKKSKSRDRWCRWNRRAERWAFDGTLADGGVRLWGSAIYAHMWWERGDVQGTLGDDSTWQRPMDGAQKWRTLECFKELPQKQKWKSM